jgi:hypothetical protein
VAGGLEHSERLAYTSLHPFHALPTSSSGYLPTGAPVPAEVRLGEAIGLHAGELDPLISVRRSSGGT